jgi:mono/diheme cytochrome c family protein
MVGAVLVVQLLLIGLMVGLVYLTGRRQLNQPFDNPVPDVAVAASPEQVARGAYLVRSFADCVSCHASDPTADPPVLDGGYLADLAALGTFYAPNITPGRLADWSDGEIVRAIREGVSRDGRGLLIMPSDHFRHLSDEDVHAIVAYLRHQPPVQRETPPLDPNFLGSMLLGSGQVGPTRQPPLGRVTAPPRGPTAEYGAYLVSIGGCTSCHGPRLDGEDVPPGPPPGPSLRSVQGWTDEQFRQAMRTGMTPQGQQFGEAMPWRAYGQGTDDDLRAVYAFLRTLP